MPRKVYPQPCPDWPGFFWARAEGSYLGNDLACRRCGGSGLAVGAADDLLALPVEEALCPLCRGSGLLVPRRHYPEGIRELLALAEDRLGWTCVGSDQLRWPLGCIWLLDRARFPIKDDLYHADADKLAFMVEGNVAVALFDQTPDARLHLESVFRLACGNKVGPPEFVVPWLDR